MDVPDVEEVAGGGEEVGAVSLSPVSDEDGLGWRVWVVEREAWDGVVRDPLARRSTHE